MIGDCIQYIVQKAHAAPRIVFKHHVLQMVQSILFKIYL